MFQLAKIERILHPCLQIDCSDEILWPLIDDEEIGRIQSIRDVWCKLVYCYPYLRKNSDGILYIDIYLLDTRSRFDRFHRFIICEGCRMSEKKEFKFLELIRREGIHMKPELFDTFNNAVNVLFPFGNYRYDLANNLGMALESLYYSSHRSGAKEILYKAGLDQIAWNLHKMPSINLAGSSPDTIIANGTFSKLLRILNDDKSVESLFNETSIETAKKTYRKFSDYIGNVVLTEEQWEFLILLIEYEEDDDASCYGPLLKKVLFIRNFECFIKDYRRFFQLRKQLKDIYQFQIPEPVEVGEIVSRMNVCLQFKDLKIDDLQRDKYECEDDDYVVFKPDSVLQFYEEATNQHNCLMGYVESCFRGDTVILFLRKKQSIDTSFVTIEIRNNKMVQVLGQYNKYPNERVYRFLNKYSQEKGIEFDPADLICIEYCSDELLQYLQDFRAAKNPFFWRHKEKRPGVQMTIWSIINSDEIPREFDCADFPYDLF